MKRIAINGYGRIGRNVHRQLLDDYSDSVQVVGINASSTAEMREYLLKYDSLHGRFSGTTKLKDDDTIIVNGQDVRIVKEHEASNCPWKELDIDVVIESTGHFASKKKSQGHIDAGAKRVIITAPVKDDTPSFVLGVNENLLTADMHIVSNASCTTNCIAPVVKVIHEEFGVANLLVNSVHAFTASQNLLDNKGEGSDLRRARAATLSIIPTKTGAVQSIGSIFPDLEGKVDGMAFRVPVPTVSCAYMAFTLEKATTADEINKALKKAASSKSMQTALAVCDEQCVSIDFQTDPHSSIVDSSFTKVVGGKTAQVLSWYDNEWGYAMRVSELLQLVISHMK